MSTASQPPLRRFVRVFSAKERVFLLVAIGAGVVAGLSHYLDGSVWLSFGASLVAIAAVAVLIGAAVEQLSGKMSQGAVSFIQNALANLPELFINLFALQAGLVSLVQASLIGSVLASLLLLMSISFMAGGFKNGRQKISGRKAREFSVLLVIASFALILPTVATAIHAPVAGHEDALSFVTAGILLLLFIGSVVASFRSARETPLADASEQIEPTRWPIAVTLGVLAAAAVFAAFASDWFVEALQPVMSASGLNPTFVGLVVVAVAGNAVENVVGIQQFYKNRSELGFELNMTGPVQILLFLVPMLVVLSALFGFAPLSLVFPPLLAGSLFVSVLIVFLVSEDGESNWLEGLCLFGVYGLIASSFWWG